MEKSLELSESSVTRALAIAEPTGNCIRPRNRLTLLPCQSHAYQASTLQVYRASVLETLESDELRHPPTVVSRTTSMSYLLHSKRISSLISGILCALVGHDHRAVDHSSATSTSGTIADLLMVSRSILVVDLGMGTKPLFLNHLSEWPTRQLVSCAVPSKCYVQCCLRAPAATASCNADDSCFFYLFSCRILRLFHSELAMSHDCCHI